MRRVLRYLEGYLTCNCTVVLCQTSCWRRVAWNKNYLSLGPLNLLALNEALSLPSLDLKNPTKDQPHGTQRTHGAAQKIKNTGRGAKHPAALGFRANPYMVDEKLVCT